MKSTPLLYLGATGWTHPAWRQGFYPDDLPEDWMLSYYNTRFQAVFLPATELRQAGPDIWKQWMRDTMEHFVFIVEDASDVWIPASGRVRRATGEWRAKHLCWLEDIPDLRALSQRILAHVQTGEPLYLISRSGDLALLQRAESLREVLGY